MPRLQAPDFAPESGFQVDEGFLAPELMAELRRLVNKARPRPSAEQVSELVCAVAGAAHLAFELRSGVPTARIVAELTALARAAAGLQDALRGLSSESASAFNAHGAALAFNMRPPAALSTLARELLLNDRDEGGLLRAVFDLAADLGAAAQYTRRQCSPRRGSKVTDANARTLVRLVALACRPHLGRLPPREGDTWFSEFMRKLGAAEPFRMRIGAALVAAGVREAAAQFPPSNRRHAVHWWGALRSED